MAHSAPKLLDYLHDQLRAKHYSIRTETADADWVRRLILCHHKRHAETMAEPEINGFLTSLAVQGRVAAYTQNQAQSALLFLYRQVLQIELDGPLSLVWAKKASACPLSSPAPRCRPSWPCSPANSCSWRNCFVAAACV